jgi:galactokinase/mevalonate kinase-like predicted kinase
MQTLISLPGNLVGSFHEVTGLGREEWFVAADPKGARVGSGGGTAWLLAEHKKTRMAGAGLGEYLASGKRVIIHAGGQSRRLPAYAPSGKLLAPIPVFRWSRGQRMDQCLLDVQMPLLTKLLAAAGAGQNTLVASGDVLILPGELPFELPAADVVCLGMWVDPHLASRHGVFFASRQRPRELDFMLQKPTGAEIEKLAGTHLFLMDVGLWVLSDRAVELLMKKCGWGGDGFLKGTPGYYDLYGAFGTCLGAHPSQADAEIRQLTTALVSLDRGEFYHYGTSAELISSTEKIQNRVQDQRNIWHNRVKPHPSLFVMNADTVVNWERKHHIWIENSHVGAGWRLSFEHVITGVPANEWKLELPAGVCLDVAPVGEREYCVRPYGMEDTFRGAVGEGRTLWMDRPVGEWLAARGISWEEAGIDRGTDIQNAKLFPVVECGELTEGLIRWMVGGEAGDDKVTGAMRTLWLTRERLSADEISERANLVRLFKQREELRRANLVKIAANYKRSVFYQADLRQAAADWAKAGHALPAALPESEQAMLRFRDHMFRSEVLRRKGQDGSAEERKAFEVLRASITGTLSGGVVPRMNVQGDQIVWGRSPARLDLAGGWSDTPPYCLQNGGAVVNVAVELNGQPPIQVYIRPSGEKRIVLRSIDTGAAEEVRTFEELRAFDQVGSAFSIPKAALYLAGFHPDRCEARYNTLEEQLAAFGGGFEISLLAAIPKGSGLGTSSILAATILGSLADFCGLSWDQQAICHRTLVLEQLLTTGGGWQDQYGGILPGVKLLESEPGTQERIGVRWLPEQLFRLPEYKDCWLLYYTGVTRVAKNILADIVRGMFLNEGQRLRIVDEIRGHAYRMADAIGRTDWRATGRMVAESWKLNNALDSGTNTPEVQRIIDVMSDYALGYKLLGAGGGGYMVICAKEPEAAVRIQRVLNEKPPTDKARFVKMDVSARGFQVSRS